MKPKNDVGKSTGKLSVKSNILSVRTLGILATLCMCTVGAQATEKLKPQL